MSDRGLCRKSYPHFRRNRYKHLAALRHSRKKLCFQYLWELLFLRLTHKFSVPLFRRLGADFSGSLIKIHRYICYASVSAASVLYKGLGLCQQAKTDTARQEPDLAVFRECGHTPYACYVTPPPVPLPPSSVLTRHLEKAKMSPKGRRFREKSAKK